MKKIYLLASTALLAITTVHAQITEGKWLAIGGISGGFNNRTTAPNEESKGSQFGVQLQLGKAIKNNVVVGGLVGFNASSNRQFFNNNEISRGNFNSATIGVFARHYKSLGKGFNIFAQSTALVNTSRDKTNIPNGASFVNSRSTSAGIGLAPGIAYQIAKKLQVELVANNLLLLQYHNSKQYSVNQPTRTNNSFNASSSLNNGLNLGAMALGFTLIL
ncbi:MAG: hypothetical protein EAY72_10345 [Bacteroidetes bacterium]|nr:MAG: hypothetical protein EAY72_10345 [Bacteroidota bacterium]TAE70737.1 MAG: hypothetical protein EAY68_02570 [Bacteroidota bacterium]